MAMTGEEDGIMVDVAPKPRKRLTQAEALEQVRAQINEDQPGLNPNRLQTKTALDKKTVNGGLPCLSTWPSTWGSKRSIVAAGYGHTE
jgi:hypothetical protein